MTHLGLCAITAKLGVDKSAPMCYNRIDALIYQKTPKAVRNYSTDGRPCQAFFL